MAAEDASARGMRRYWVLVWGSVLLLFALIGRILEARRGSAGGADAGSADGATGGSADGKADGNADGPGDRPAGRPDLEA